MKITRFMMIGLLTTGIGFTGQQSSHQLPPLPYEKNALEPYVTSKTLDFHYGKHHQGYLTNLNKLIETNKSLQGKTLEEVIMLSSKNDSLKSVFNNAAQTWNHTFYWKSMKHNGGGQPTGELLNRINRDFGSYEAFKKKFIDESVKVFGSGWVWLIEAEGKLQVVTTKDGDLPMIQGQKALITCDVWEHAYYLDYQNRRKDYVEVFLDHLVNWDFALSNLA